jgi:hypothetical protein
VKHQRQGRHRLTTDVRLVHKLMQEALPADHVSAVRQAAQGGSAKLNLRKMAFPEAYASLGARKKAFDENDARKPAGHGTLWCEGGGGSLRCRMCNC